MTSPEKNAATPAAQDVALLQVNNSECANAVFSVSTVWQGGMKSEAVCQSSVINGETVSGAAHTLRSDEPALLGGTATAPCPQELLLAAFNACLTACYVTAAATEGVRLEKLKICTAGEIDLGRLTGTGPGASAPDTLRYMIHVKGAGSVAQFEKIHQLTILASPNRWIIGEGVLIEGDQMIEKSSPAAC